MRARLRTRPRPASRLATAVSRLLRSLAAASLVAGLVALAWTPLRAAPTGPFVYVLPTTGIVDAVLAEYVENGIEVAAADGAVAVIIQLDTPGGSLEAMSRITSALLEAPLPTIVWVAPAGGRAASAGTFITLAAAVALMAPGTNIGAASPVGGGGEDIGGTLGEKVRNDAIANISAIAEARGRNVAWAVSTVEKAVSSPASEAVRIGAVDGLAGSIEEVLAAADGREVTVGGRQVVLALAGAAPVPLEMNPFQGLLHTLSDPNVAFLLFTVGTYGLIYEVISPNLITGAVGAIAILLAFIGFGSLPLNLAGLLLIGLAVLLFIAEAFITSHGFLTIGGLVSFALGASALYTAPASPAAPDVTVAFPLLAVMVGTTALLMGLIAVAGFRTRRIRGSPGTVGEEALPVGTRGEVRRPLDPLGSIYAGGEEWTARSVDGSPIDRGTDIRVVGRDGLTIVVAPVDAAPVDAAPEAGEPRP